MIRGALSVEEGSGIFEFPLAEPALLAEAQALVAHLRDTPVAELQAMDDRTHRRPRPRAPGPHQRGAMARPLRAIEPARYRPGGWERRQTSCYLRSVRPDRAGRVQESIGWHRESFYGPGMQRAYNLWIPLVPVTVENALRYVPRSQLIPDSAIVCENIDESSSSVERNSDGHRLGLLYSPKRIVAGVDLSTARRLQVDVGAFAIFPASLIHGAGSNRSSRVRLSIDMRIVRCADVAEPHVQGSTRALYFRGLGPDAPAT